MVFQRFLQRKDGKIPKIWIFAGAIALQVLIAVSILTFKLLVSSDAAAPQVETAAHFSGGAVKSGLPPASAKLRGLGFALPPDTRPKACRRDFEGVAESYNSNVTIIIPYLHESWEHLSKTLRSLLHFTPDSVIKEYLFVSDGNPPEKTFESELMAMSPKVRVIVNSQRTGLMRAKMKAAEEAKGSILVFMEAHVIANKDWLLPLLLRITNFPRALVQPTLDIIPQDNFDQYQRAGMGHWRFEWNMNVIFTSPPDRSALDSSSDQPTAMPATSGGIFAIRRDWWNKLGLYDPELKEWGGDHVEATMKVWRCGGHIEMHPCSRVGHLFRDPDHRPYPVKVPQVVRNYARLAAVWWDDYLKYFQRMKPETRVMPIGDVAPQLKLREVLQCEDMEWYLKYVDPEMEWEANHICVPGADKSRGGCEKKAAHGRSTIDRIMPAAEYKARRAEIQEYWNTRMYSQSLDDDENEL